MTEIPEHLRKRAQDARDKAARSTTISNGEIFDPFKSRRETTAAEASRLILAKINLHDSVTRVRDTLKDEEPTKLAAQIVIAKTLRVGASFVPPRSADADFYFTIHQYKEAFTPLDETKSVRIGEQQSWRMPFSKDELGATLKNAGLRPIRDTWKLAKTGSLYMEDDQISPSTVQRIIDSSIAERATCSVALYEGVASQESYAKSYRQRYGASVSIVRNPSETPIEQSVFSIDLESLEESFSTDEGSSRDGALYDSERLTSAMSSLLGYGPRPTEVALAQDLERQTQVFNAFNELVREPSATTAAATFQAVDVSLRR